MVVLSRNGIVCVCVSWCLERWGLGLGRILGMCVDCLRLDRFLFRWSPSILLHKCEILQLNSEEVFFWEGGCYIASGVSIIFSR